jgi:hypothetical protein
MRGQRMMGMIAGMMTLACHGGCDASKTETGYNPHKVGMNNNELRSLYAPAFSPEAHAAEEDKKPEGTAHRPGT